MKLLCTLLPMAALLPWTLYAEGPVRHAKADKEDPAQTQSPVPIISTRENSSLVRVNVTQQPWNYRIPWQKVSPTGRRGLGVLVDDKNHILVTAQLVADATYIELEAAATGRKLTAKVLAVDYEANLALVQPTQAPGDFFAGLKPVEIDTQARQGDSLELWQLGRVGDLIATKLSLNKVQTARYFLESSQFLVYETYGIIRSEGNSFTLPIIHDDKLAGLLLRYDSKNQAATVLPGPIIEHFLKDYASGNYQGFPSLGIEFHTTLDPEFRAYIGLKNGEGGVYVGAVTKGGSAESVGIKAGDIVLELNGQKVDTRGDYKDPVYGTLSCSHLVRDKAYVGEEVKVKVQRDGKPLELSGKLTRKNLKDNIVWPYLFDRGSNYLVEGGLIFQDLSVPYLQSFGEDWENSAPLRLVFAAKHTDELEKEGRRKIVILGGVLPTSSTQGYQQLGGLIVTKVNDKPINDLNDLNAAFKEAKDGIHKIEFEEFPRIIYLDAATTEVDNMHLLNGPYRISSLKRIE